MSRPQLTQESFLGFQRDVSRDQLPRGYAYDSVNLLPYLGAPARKRGGWSYKGSALTSIYNLAGYPQYVAFGPFVGIIGNQLLTVEDHNYHLLDITNSADKGAWQNSLQAPIFYRDMLIGAGAGGIAPKKYTAGLITALGGTAPFASNLCVHKDRLLATDQTNNLGKVFFSDAGDPTTFDTANRFLNTSATVVGMASLGTAVIVFHSGSVERIRGSVPPGSAAADMVLEPLYKEVGLYEPNAFAVTDDSVIWADEDGIYQSDGASFSDLTKQGGIKKYWTDQVATASASGAAKMALGAWKGWAFVSLLWYGADSDYADFLMCDIKTRSWFRCDNIRAKNFASRPGNPDEFYFSNQSSKYVGELSSIFTPSATYNVDGNGLAVTPLLDTQFYTFGAKGKKRSRFAYVGHDLRGTGPTLDVSYATTPEATSYTASSSLPVTTTYSRKRVPIGKSSYGYSLRLTTSGTADDLKLYSLESGSTPLEQSRR